MCPLPPPSPPRQLKAEKKEMQATKEKRSMSKAWVWQYGIVAKIVLKKKKRKEEKARFLRNLEKNDLRMKHINVCKNKYVNSINNFL